MSTVLTKDMLNEVIAAAVQAPSVLNTQPWRFHAHDAVIDVWADPDRGLTHLDPQGRELLISCGAALYNLRLTLHAVGRAATVRVLPDPERPTWIAQVHVGGVHHATPGELRLRAEIPRRRTTREPFERSDLPGDVVLGLQEAASLEGARLEQPPSWHRSALAGLVRDAARQQRADPSIVADIRSWTGDRAPAGAGIPADRLGPKPTEPTALVRDFAVGERVDGREPARFREEGLLLVLLTDHDAPVDRVRAGEALERVWLEATAAGLAVSLLTQPTEVAELRPWLRDPGSPWGSPQVLLRLGYGPNPVATDRRPVAEVLEVT